jgi:hypothetical protein
MSSVAGFTVSCWIVRACHFGLRGHRTWQPTTFSCEITSQIPYIDIGEQVTCSSQTIHHCSCWNCNFRHAKSCIGWNQLLDYVNIYFQKFYWIFVLEFRFSVYIVVKNISTPKNIGVTFCSEHAVSYLVDALRVSSPDEMDFSNLPNLSGRTMTLGSTQPQQKWVSGIFLDI